MRGSAQPLVGRSTELQLLEDRLFRDAEQPTVVAVTGDAGIGKSRLVGEMRAIADRRGITTIGASCLHLAGGAAPLAAISSALVGTLRLASTARRARLLKGLTADLAPILPSSLRGADFVTRDSETAPVRQQRIFDALLELFERIEPGRMLLLLEDLHWADEATTDFLRFVARNAGNLLTSVVTVRTEPARRISATGEALLELERAGDLQRIELGPLPAGDIGQMVSNLLGRAITPTEAGLLHSRSDGNPYYAQELALAGIAGHPGVPPSLQDVLLARFATQPARVQALLRELAVLGREASDEVLLSVGGGQPREIVATLRLAVEARVIEPAATPQDGIRYRHALMREAVYADLLPTERRRIHRRVATVLEGRFGTEPLTQEQASLLAHHWEAGGDVNRSLVARSTAADLAMSAGAMHDAYQHSLAALNLWHGAGAAARAATGPPGALHLRFTALALGNGHYAEGQRALEEALALGVPRDVAEEVLTLDYRCLLLWALGDHEGSVAAARKALRVAPASRPDLRSRAHRMMAGLHYIQRRPEEALACATEGLQHAMAAGDRTAERYLRWVIASCSLDNGDIEGGMREGAASYSLGDLVDPVEPFVGPSNYAVLLASSGQYAEVLDFAASAQDAIRRHGLEQSHGTLMGNMRLVALTRLGRLRDAAELLDVLDATVDLYADLATERLAFAAELRLRQGRLREAAELVERCNAGRNAWTQEWTTANVTSTEGQLAAWEGHPERAVKRTEEEWAQLSGRVSTLRLRLLATMSQLHADAHRRRRGRDTASMAKAAALNEVAKELAAEFRGRTPEWDALMVQADAEYRRISGDRAVERWTEAVRLWDEAGLPYEATYARCRLGEQLLHARRRASATAVMREAAAMASGIGAAGLATMAAEIMARGRLETADRMALAIQPDSHAETRAQVDALAELSQREHEVLGLVAEGKTNRQIADQLYISEKTAATHVSNILGKLQASSRAQAAAILVGATASRS